ncbi:MAG TPA: Uma2 family endonuclease [Polyangiaceae bacterium]
MLGSEPLVVHFPESAEVPEHRRHLRLRTLLFQFLEHAFGHVAAVGSEQFVYWDPTNPHACLCPDAFVRFGARSEDFPSWKVWERGAPHVAVEIISQSDASESSWLEKLERYRRLGVSELVWFNPETPERPLRIWDFVGDDLLERRLFEPWAQSRHLGGYWLPVEQSDTGLSLRLSRDPDGLQLFPTPEEAQAEGRRAEAEGRRAVEEQLRLKSEALAAAEQRIAELEASLGRKP